MNNEIDIINYKIYLNLNINLKEPNYNGLVEIKIKTKKDHKKIELDSNGITIINIIINDQEAKFFIDNSRSKIILQNNLERLKIYRIKIFFRNNFSKNLEGFIQTSVNNSLFYYTDLQPYEVTRFIPCFADPKYKATIDMVIKAPNNIDCLFNTKIFSVKIIDNYKIIRFTRVPKISIYLIALALGKFIKQYEESFTSNLNKKHNIYTVNEKDHELIDYMRVTIIECMNYFEKYFDFEYPLDKLDFLIVPNLIPAGTENFGLIFLKDYYYDSKDKTKKFFLDILYHEITHQWIGNIVTLSSWDYIWLNESISNWVSWKGLISTQNKLLIEYSFLQKEYYEAQNLDSMPNTFTIYTPNIKIKDENVFSRLIYNKGCIIFKYIDGLMNKGDFDLLMKDYVKKYKYLSIGPNDFFNELKKYDDNNILLTKILMDQLGSYGFPILEVKIIDKKLIIKKNRFINTSNIKESYETSFFLKISYEKNNTIVCKRYLINSNEQTLDLESDIFYLNPSNELLCIINYINYNPICYSKIDCTDLIKYINDLYLLMIGKYIEFIDYTNKIINIFDRFIIKIIETNILIINEILVQIIKILDICNIDDQIKNIFDPIIIKLKEKIIMIVNNDFIFKEEFLNNIFLLLTIYYPDTYYIKLLRDFFNINNKCIISSYSNIVKNYPNEYMKVFELLSNSFINPDYIIQTFHYINQEQYDWIKENYIVNLDKTKLPMVYGVLSKNLIIKDKLVKHIITKQFYEFINNKTNYYLILIKIVLNIFDLELLNIMEKSIYINNYDLENNLWKNIVDIINLNRFISMWIKKFSDKELN